MEQKRIKTTAKKIKQGTAVTTEIPSFARDEFSSGW
jgi:hypothetical protein